ncbi:MAG: hypothetical protein Q4E44_06935 [bacterium]|nr:hypothetical protein [bacterium]
MRKGLIFVLATLTYNISAQETEKMDTVSIEKPERVTIIQSDKKMNVTVHGKEYDAEYKLERYIEMPDTVETVTSNVRSEKRFLPEVKLNTGVSFGISPSFELGLLFPMATPHDMKTTTQNWEMRFNLLTFKYVPKRGPWWFTVNGGISLSQYAMKKNRFVGDGNYNLSIAPFPEGAEKCWSGLSIWSGDLMLLGHLSVGKRSSLAAGVILSGHYKPFGNNCHSKYIDAEGKEVSEMHRIDPRRNNLSFRLEYSPARYGKLYMTFSPWSAFKNNQGPQFSTIAIGCGVFY